MSLRSLRDRLEEAERKYGRDDVDYDTWYNPWMKQLALRYTRDELEDQLYGAGREAKRAAGAHLRAIEKTTSMRGRSQARAQTRNVAAAAGDFKIALDGALEIHDLFPEHAKQ